MSKIAEYHQDVELSTHIRSLNAGSVTGYKLWCHRNGLSTDLMKRPEQRVAEIELYNSLQPKVDPDLSKDHDPQRAALFKRILRGELQDVSLTDTSSRIRKLYKEFEGDEEARCALELLVLHTEKYSRFFRPKPMVKRWGNTFANTHFVFRKALE